MKKIIAIAFLFTVQVINAQEVTQNLGDYNAVKVYDKINVKLVAGQENKIVIKGSKAADAEVVTKNNELKIRMKLSKLLSGDDITATLYYKTINRVEAFEGSYVSSEDIFKSSSFTLNAKEGAKIKLNLDVQTLDSDVSSGGELEITGTAATHDLDITSGGIAKAKNLQTATTTVNVKAGGTAAVFATDVANAKTMAGGTVDIYGNPKQVNQKTTAGGTITVRK